jgi:hypothetical protein
MLTLELGWEQLTFHNELISLFELVGERMVPVDHTSSVLHTTPGSGWRSFGRLGSGLSLHFSLAHIGEPY